MFLNKFWQYALVYILVSFATTISIDLMNGIMSLKVEPGRLGEMIGLNSAVENISLILGPVIGSSLLGAADPRLYGASSAVFTVIALLIGRRFLGFLPYRRKKIHTDGLKLVEKNRLALSGVVVYFAGWSETANKFTELICFENSMELLVNVWTGIFNVTG
jgi:hypothetical protein